MQLAEVTVAMVAVTYVNMEARSMGLGKRALLPEPLWVPRPPPFFFETM